MESGVEMTKMRCRKAEESRRMTIERRDRIRGRKEEETGCLPAALCFFALCAILGGIAGWMLGEVIL